MSDTAKLIEEFKLYAQYMAISEAMGPSKQLIAFINHDASLGQEMGLESHVFDKLSADAQHEIISKSIPLSQVKRVALESFDAEIKKAKHEIEEGSSALQTEFKKSFGFFSSVKKFVANLSYVGKVVPPTQYFKAIKLLNDHLDDEADYFKHIPTSDDHVKWVNFHAQWVNHYKQELGKNREDFKHELDGIKKGIVDFSHAGWTDASVREAQKDLAQLVARAADMSSRCKELVDDIEKWVQEELDAIDEHMSDHHADHEKRNRNRLPHEEKTKYSPDMAENVQLSIEAAIAHASLVNIWKGLFIIDQAVQSLESMLRSISRGFDITEARK